MQAPKFDGPWALPGTENGLDCPGQLGNGLLWEGLANFGRVVVKEFPDEAFQRRNVKLGDDRYTLAPQVLLQVRSNGAAGKPRAISA